MYRTASLFAFAVALVAMPAQATVFVIDIDRPTFSDTQIIPDGYGAVPGGFDTYYYVDDLDGDGLDVKLHVGYDLLDGGDGATPGEGVGTGEFSYAEMKFAAELWPTAASFDIGRWGGASPGAAIDAGFRIWDEPGQNIVHTQSSMVDMSTGLATVTADASTLAALSANPGAYLDFMWDGDGWYAADNFTVDVDYDPPEPQPPLPGIINVDFDVGGQVTYNPATDGAPYPGAVADEVWNSFAITGVNGDPVGTQTSASLLESDGVTDSGVTVTLDGGYVWRSTPGPLAGDLFADFVWADMPETVAFSIDNLTPGGRYDLYLYGGSQDNYNYGDNGLGANFTIDGVTKTCAYSGQTLPDLVWMEGDQYVLFSDLAADGSGTISGIVDGTGMDLEELSFNGLTIVTLTPTMQWDGGTGNWAHEKWDDGSGGPLAAPTADTPMVIDVAGSQVTVAADFISGGTGPAGSIDLGENNTASLIVNNGATLEVTVDVAVGPAGTLRVDGTLDTGSLATEPGSTVGGSGTIGAAGEVALGGIVAPGDSIGVLTLDGSGAGSELFDSAVYECEIGADDAPIANDAINVVAGDFALGGTLELVATSKLRGPDGGGQWVGEQTRAIAAAVGENSILYYFETTPTPLPVDFGAAEWGEGHLGRGVFLTRDNNGGENDVEGVSYSTTGTQVHLFQALDGDTNGDMILDTGDIFAILGAGSFLTPGEWDWTEGDFDGDTDVDTDDIFAILATGQWGDFTPYYPPAKASTTKGEGDAVVDLIVDPETGEVSVDTNGAEITGYLISSESGALTGEAATQFTLSEQTADQIADMLPLGKAFAGVHELGSVLDGDGSDLTLTYTLSGQAGVFQGNVKVVPEPGTLAMLLVGLLGLLLVAVRRRPGG